MSAVRPTYTSQSRRAVVRIEEASGSYSGPGISDSTSTRAPPTRRRGRIARLRTTIPIPPSHCEKQRHMPIV